MAICGEGREGGAMPPPSWRRRRRRLRLARGAIDAEQALRGLHVSAAPLRARLRSFGCAQRAPNALHVLPHVHGSTVHEVWRAHRRRGQRGGRSSRFVERCDRDAAGGGPRRPVQDLWRGDSRAAAASGARPRRSTARAAPATLPLRRGALLALPRGGSAPPACRARVVVPTTEGGVSPGVWSHRGDGAAVGARRVVPAPNPAMPVWVWPKGHGQGFALPAARSGRGGRGSRPRGDAREALCGVQAVWAGAAPAGGGV
mmetsp:Transcript_36796/g.121952  ORF Transcript_36796/g.121952 Transcript_36796/m.121952 type:complete len:258 (+) Transcript_36796:846-1619(+)